MNSQTKGFTLIELLIVIAIIAILFAAVILTLNPAQLLKQSRDSTRLSDLATLRSAMSLFIADGQTAIGTTSVCYAHASSGVTTAGCNGRAGVGASDTVTTSSARNVVNSPTAWIPVNFSAISSGSPLSVEPVDPVNNGTYFYTYAVNTTNMTFEFTALMESTKYGYGGNNDVVSTDGGNASSTYEVGTAFGL